MCFLPPADVIWTWVFFFLIPFVGVLPFIRFVAETGKHNYTESTIYAATISNIGFIHRWSFHPHGDGFHVLHHLYPSVPQFKLASRNRFFLCIESRDPAFRFEETHRFLESLNPHSLVLVPR